MNELAGHKLGGYQLEEEIGRGSMGVVYRSKQLALGREVAVKVLPQSLAQDASYVARFIRETQIIAGLNHPNIVHIYDAGQQNTLLYFAMEYVQGPTLASLLYLDGIIPPYLAVEYAAQIADALDAAYRERNVIHRDIKPENLMLNRWGKIKVMDFGLARASGLQPITVAQTLVGSIYYSSPEQIWGNTLDNRSDIFALGTVLYEMVSGRRPFTGRSMPDLTKAITVDPLTPPSNYNPEIPPRLEKIILTALAKDRYQRYADASLMAHELRALHLQPDIPEPIPIVDRPGEIANNTSEQQPEHSAYQHFQAQPDTNNKHAPGLQSAYPTYQQVQGTKAGLTPEQMNDPVHFPPTTQGNEQSGQFRSMSRPTRRLSETESDEQEQIQEQSETAIQRKTASAQTEAINSESTTNDNDQPGAGKTTQTDQQNSRDLWKKIQRLFNQTTPES